MRYILILFASLFLTVQCEGQTFTKVFSNSDSLIGMSGVTPINSGGWYASGFKRDYKGIFSFLTKFDVDGNLLWSKIPDETRDPRALVALNDGTALFFNNNSGFQGYFDASVLHIDTDGSFISETIWGKLNDQDDWFDAKKMDNGEVIAIGISRESSAFEERTLLVKFSATGQIVWEKTYKGALIGRFTDILPLPSGDFYAIGQNNTLGTNIGMLGKFKANGDVEWVKTYDYAPRASYFLAGLTLPDGSAFVASYSTTLNGLDATLTLLNISSSGAVTNQKSLKSSYDIGPFKVGKLNNDTLLITARSSVQSGSTVDYDNLILQVSPQGDLLDNLSFGTDGQDLGFDAFFIGRQVVLCGTTDTSADGTARRAFLSKTAFNTSCCEKGTFVQIADAPPLPLIADLSFSSSMVPTKQNHTVAMPNYPLTESLSCQNPDGAVLLPPNKNICIGDTLQLSLIANIPGNVLWSTGATTPTIFVDTPGTYSVTLNGECGNASDAIEVVAVGNRVTAAVAPVEDICSGEQIVLEASGGADFIWYDATGMAVFTIANPTITPMESTNYIVVVADGACRDTATVAIDVLSAPTISAGSDFAIKLGGQVQLKATGGVSYTWQPSAGLSCSDCPSPLASPSITTTYLLTGTDANGCSDTAAVTVLVAQPCPFYIPNIFSPEGENGSNNDRFGVFSNLIDPMGYVLRIYSRWGELVFESKNPQQLWDGTFKNKPAQQGVYMYQLQMNTCDGLVQKSGDLTLVR
jgi:gliding motility-associated-like protein